ncbi:MAG: hypothetical protein ACFFAQ_09240 [Promethearchaeota archaeon]
MADIKDYLWVFPIVGAIFGIITFLAPAADWTYSYGGYISIDWYCWIWGLTSVSASYGPYSTNEFGLITDNMVLAVSIISTIIIAIGIVVLIIGGVLSKRSTQYNMNLIIMSSIGALLLLIGPIIWLIGADWPIIGEITTPPGYDFWDWFDVNFGIIAPFIGTAIAFIGVGLYYYYLKEKAGIREPKREVGEKEPVKEKPATLKFCPECGQKIEQEGVTVCPSCGFKF